MPGVLPVLNRTVVEYTLRMALATHCTIARQSRFARKNYFYPDLPKGYQISQYELPIAENGYIDLDMDSGPKRIGITRIHMEEDAGKLIHETGRPHSRVDFNRTGVPLIEIVSEPDLRTPEEAGAYLRKLRAIVRYLEICDGNLEEGSFRCDANISIRPKGADAFGTRTEIKNLNSFKNVEKALEYEISRQKDVLVDGGEVIQETRLWDPDRNRSTSMRGKEDAHDYRYFPDPDLLPLIVDDPWIAAVERTLPELPDPKKARFMAQYDLPAHDAERLTDSRELADYFEACLADFPQPKPVCNWITGTLLGLLNAQGKSIAESPVASKDLAGLLQLIDQGVISGKIAKTVFEEMAASGKPPRQVVEEKKLVQVTDTDAIERVVVSILADNPKEVDAYRNGKTKLLGFFVGQVMQATKGKANPQIVNEVLRQKLAS
jgi:aspartyl-tRNA(Asn)/glutamyl-tRNA(Gln) amidotransferase subunit B